MNIPDKSHPWRTGYNKVTIKKPRGINDIMGYYAEVKSDAEKFKLRKGQARKRMKI